MYPSDYFSNTREYKAKVLIFCKLYSGGGVETDTKQTNKSIMCQMVMSAKKNKVK